MLKYLPVDPTSIIVNHSGGKDSTAMLEAIAAYYGNSLPIFVLHQHLPEAWPGTVEYVEAHAEKLGLPFHVIQMHYLQYECASCGTRYLSQTPKLTCYKCRAEAGVEIGVVDNLLKLMRHRGAWPSDSIRWCTSYGKRDIANRWATEHRHLLGDRPVMAMGERWAESRRRAKLDYVELREGRSWLLNWHPILHLSRREVFQAIFEAGLEPHYCYELQGMSRDDMLRDEEGGPRCSCIACIYLTPQQVAFNLNLPMNAELRTELLAFEAESGHHFRQNLPLAEVLNGVYTAPKIVRNQKERKSV